MKSGTSTILAVFAATAGLTACGSAEGPTTFTGEELVVRVDGACRTVNAQLDEIEKARKALGANDIGPTEENTVFQDFSREIDRYRPPSDPEADYSDFTDVWRQIVRLRSEKNVSIYEFDETGYERASARLDIEVRNADEAAKLLGFSGC